MAINTPSDLITDVLSYSGVISDGQSPSARDINRIFDDLNLYISTLNNTRFLIFAEQAVRFTCTGQKSYTIGSTAEIDTPRPDRLQAANLKWINQSGPSGPLTTQLRIIQSYEDYSQISLPNLVAPPTQIFYDTQYPIGNIFPYPIPPGGNQFAIDLIIKVQIPQFTSLTQQIILPPEYLNALKWVMVCRTRGAYQLPEDRLAIQLAKSGLETIRMANSQASQMSLPPSMLPIRSTGLYGIGGFQLSGL